MRRTSPLRAAAALLALGLLAGAAPVDAAFIITPLQVTSEPSEPANRQQVRLTIDATNQTSQDAWKDRTIKVAWEVVDAENGAASGTIRDELRLDGKAHATLDWTVPAEADDRNIFVVLWSGDERLGQAHLRVGDAEPMAFTLGGPGGDEPVNVDDGAKDPGTDGSTDRTGGEAQRGDNRTPGFAGILALAGLGAVALLVARRR